MRSRRNVLGLTVRDCEGRDVGRVVGTWPEDGSWEVELIVVRLPRFGARRMLPAADVVVDGGGARAGYGARRWRTRRRWAGSTTRTGRGRTGCSRRPLC